MSDDERSSEEQRRFEKRVQELIDGNPEAAKLQREKQVEEGQPSEAPSEGDIVMRYPGGLSSLSEWLSGSQEDPAEVFLHRRPEDLYVGFIYREEVRPPDEQ